MEPRKEMGIFIERIGMIEKSLRQLLDVVS